jgi:hypothetical protein
MIKDHGPLATLLLFLEVHEQLKMGHICKRAYNTTVPWNMSPILLPFDSPCDFPNIRTPSENHVCKSINATIEGEEGVFHGIVCKSSGIPDGFGVFVTGYWVHCGQVKKGFYQQGKKVSVNKGEKLLRLTNKKCLADETVLEKIEQFSDKGVARDFYKNGKWIDTINPRLNLRNDA